MKTKPAIAALFFLFMAIAFSGCGKKSQEPDPPVTPPVISIDDISLFEGTASGPIFGFTVRLSKTSDKEVKVKWSTQDGTAKAGSDYTAVTNQELVFAPGEQSKIIIVLVTADEYREDDETFSVALSGAVNASIGRGVATCMIKNDDTKILFTNNGYDAPTSYAGYNLVWADEFENGAFDSNAWVFQNGDGCPNICGWGNNELEYYRPENLGFQDGKMVIEARKESYGNRSYTSSKIIGSGKMPFKFGRIDIRAILPKGKGFWPAFWLLPQDNKFGAWPSSGEIDIMELVGHEPNKVLGTAHYGPGPGSIHTSGTYTLPAGQTFNDEFHVFSLEWKQDEIRWLIDNQVYYTVKKENVSPQNYPFNEPFFFIINFAVGGDWPGTPDASSVFPQWLIVDYVRLYQ